MVESVAGLEARVSRVLYDAYANHDYANGSVWAALSRAAIAAVHDQDGLREALTLIANAPDWATASYLRSQARLALKRPGFEFCPTCGGEFDEGEWNASNECPECETPKIDAALRARAAQ
jgi:predicted Zn-ribbon and HTH transcriptional regulator